MNTNLLQFINSLADVPLEQQNQLLSICREVSMKKGELFITEGQIPKKLGFVQKGLFRYFYLDSKGNEFTKGFFPENTFISAYSAMILESPSYLNIEALEDAEILVFDYEHWKVLLNSHWGWSRFLVKVLEKAFIKKETRERELLLFDAETRYIRFLDEYPGFDKRIKQHYIASYLGITTVALSRIRRKMGLINLC